MQPSSGAAERVFSILSNSFLSQQESSLEDYIELSISLLIIPKFCIFIVYCH